MALPLAFNLNRPIMYFILSTALIFLAIIIAFWAITDILKLKTASNPFKILWFIAILIFPILGSILYFQLGKKTLLKAPRKFDPDFQKSKDLP